MHTDTREFDRSGSSSRGRWGRRGRSPTTVSPRKTRSNFLEKREKHRPLRPPRHTLRFESVPRTVPSASPKLFSASPKALASTFPRFATSFASVIAAAEAFPQPSLEAVVPLALLPFKQVVLDRVARRIGFCPGPDEATPVLA
jgi:hypothetical protein